MRRALFAALLLVAAVLAPGLASPASAATSGACTTSKGVTVVVNFGPYGGTSARCYSGATSSTTGLSALEGAGFSPDGTKQYGLAFICRINNAPPPADESCNTTPPTTAYWSYWYASNGGSWRYSDKGVANRTVIVGGFEGWSFHTGTGSATPPTAGSPTRPVPTVQPTIKLGPAASTSTSKSSTKRSSSPTSSTAKPTATTATPTASTATSTDSSPSDTSTADTVAGAARPGDPPDSGGSPWPLVGAGSVIALIIAGAIAVSLRRRGVGGL